MSRQDRDVYGALVAARAGAKVLTAAAARPAVAQTASSSSAGA